MKKIKLSVIGLLLVIGVCALIGCGNKNNEETGSNTNSGNHNESTGVIQEIVTDAATGVKDAVTEAGTILEDAASGAGHMIDEGVRKTEAHTQTETTRP
ncbi:MAG: hypothetical protein J5981_03915 [Lachnospira sp.]|nr:hypothetical protein [Lachnospira sp.]